MYVGERTGDGRLILHKTKISTTSLLSPLLCLSSIYLLSLGHFQRRHGLPALFDVGASHIDELARSAKDLEGVAKVLWSFGAVGRLKEEGKAKVASTLWNEATRRAEEGHVISALGAELLRESELLIRLQCEGLKLREVGEDAQTRIEEAAQGGETTCLISLLSFSLFSPPFMQIAS